MKEYIERAFMEACVKFIKQTQHITEKCLPQIDVDQFSIQLLGKQFQEALLNGGEYDKFERDGDTLKLGKYIISDDGIKLNPNPEFNTLASTVVDDKGEEDNADNLDQNALQQTTENGEAEAQ